MRTGRPHRLVGLLCGVAITAMTIAQSTRATQFNAWGAANVQVQLGARWWSLFDVHWRRSNGVQDPMQLAFLVAPEYRKGGFSLQPGYGYWINYPYGAFRTPATQHEHRTWVQAGYRHSLGRTGMDHRLRLEQRFLERSRATPEGPESEGFRYVGRLRYRTRWLIPLNDRVDAQGEWQAIVSQEVMVRFGDPSFRGLFDQVRPAAQIGYRPLKDLQVLAGYQLQYLVRADGVREEFDHTLLVTLQLRLPYRAVP